MLCCLPVTNLAGGGRGRPGAPRLPILESHDLTLSRFSRYVLEAAGRCAASCRAGPGPRGATPGRGPGCCGPTVLRVCADISRGPAHRPPRPRCRAAASEQSAEIVGNQNDEIGAAGPGTLARPGGIDCCYWRRLCAGLAQFTERIQECENG